MTHWQHSDPLGYATWFWERMREEAAERRMQLSKEISASVEDVPEWKVKTTLQRAVQLLKRHRDIRFLNDLDSRPISIIITTAAAKAYRRQANLYDALRVIVRDMHLHVEKRAGIWWVPNPVNPNENFADKWRESPDRAEKFFRWLQQAQQDFAEFEVYAHMGTETLTKGLAGRFGQGVTKRAAEMFQQAKGLRTSLATVTEDIPAPADSSHRREPLWPIAIARIVRVRAEVYAKKYGTKRLRLLSISPVSKTFGIKFTAETDVIPPYEVYWQVVNTGADAVRAGQLRGGFEKGRDGQFGEVQWEETQFRGTHFMEAFVIKGGVCVARSGQVPVRIR